MKRLLLRLLLLAVIVAAVDVALGHVFGRMVSSIEVGGQGRDNYICDRTTDDILVFGSSRAVHHYNAQLLEDSLGMTCYNCGDDGNGIILGYARLHLACERHQPRVVILDVTAGYDLLPSDNHASLGWLKPHYNRDGIADIFTDIDPVERWKMLCASYRYNSRILQNTVVWLTSLSTDGGIKGFRPINRQFHPRGQRSLDVPDAYELDTLKWKYMQKFIDQAQGSQLFVVVSPQWYSTDSTKVSPTKPLEELCLRKGIPFVDFSHDPKYVHADSLYADGKHLNARGADEFTRDLIAWMKSQGMVKK